MRASAWRTALGKHRDEVCCPEMATQSHVLVGLWVKTFSYKLCAPSQGVAMAGTWNKPTAAASYTALIVNDESLGRGHQTWRPCRGRWDGRAVLVTLVVLLLTGWNGNVRAWARPVLHAKSQGHKVALGATLEVHDMKADPCRGHRPHLLWGLAPRTVLRAGTVGSFYPSLLTASEEKTIC